MTETLQVTPHGDVQLRDGIEMSEPGNAERLALIARGKIHYVDTWNAWVVYRDGQWELDGGGVGLQAFAKQVPQIIFGFAHGVKPDDSILKKKEDDRTDEENAAIKFHKLHVEWGRKSNTEPSLKRMVTLARDLPGMRISSEDLDAKPFLFNMENGTYDFQTGQFKSHDPGDLLTKKAPVWYDPEATCPMWETYLTQWQPDRLVRRFLQSITGSALIGEPVQNLFVNVGTGRNGKGTFYKQIQLMLGDYAGTAPEDMLVESRFRVHDEEKARLRGCRLLIAPETSVGDRLDEAGIKNMTGGDMIHARHLYGRPFDFKPSHTAFLHTNYEPHIRGTDPAIWNRVVKIPWETYIKEDQRDTSIDTKLEAERSGILNWLIAGCQDWMARGLKKPPTIQQATEGYRTEQDFIGRFVRETFEAMVLEANSMGPVDYIPAATVRKHYEEWCRQEGLKPWIAAAVGKELRHHGWEPTVKKVGKVTLRVWIPNKPMPLMGDSDNDVTDVTDVTGDTEGRNRCNQNGPSDQDLPILVTLVSPLSEYKIEDEQQEEQKEPKKVNIGEAETGVPGVTEEEEHRQWLYDHGYPVPPTEAELEAYLSLPLDNPYEDEEPEHYFEEPDQ